MRHLLAISLTYALALPAALGACGKGQDASQPQQPAPSAAPAPDAAGPGTALGDAGGPTAALADAAAADPPAPKVIARVGDRAITADEVAALVRARVTASGEAPTPKVVTEAVEHLVDAALLAHEARARGVAKGDSDVEVAAAFITEQLAADIAKAVTVDDLANYWRDRRRAARIIVASREAGTRAQETMLKAIAATPDRAAEIFADFYTQFDTKETDPAVAALPEKIPFDKGGRSATGEVIVPLRIAGAAFALRAVGDVSPPVALESNRWALVQLRGIHPGVPAADLTQAQLDQAREAIVEARRDAAVDATLRRLRDATDVSVDGAEIEALSKAMLRSGDSVLRRRPDGDRTLPFDVKRWRKDRLAGKRPERLEVRDLEPLRKVTTEERMEKARKHMPDGGP